MKELLAALLHLIFPTPCRVCNLPLDAQRRSLICGRCWDQVRPVPEPFCPRCGKPFASPLALEESPGHHCGACRKQPPAFAVARAAALYERGGTMREAILLFKYGGRLSLGCHLGRLMAEAAGGLFEPREFDLLVPVPLHPSRARERGFNQAAVLAKEVGSAWGRRVGYRLLRRIHATEAQSGRRPEREANVEGAFEVAQPDRVEGRRLLLIDDVFTTGATVNECAQVLLAAGAAEVAVYTLARVE
ncbi:MAG: ComF family protein [Candidatus Methylomirabilis oxyfera]|nr:ComF family protein [Candidatus Methylomirabilis oxyfera]